MHKILFELEKKKKKKEKKRVKEGKFAGQAEMQFTDPRTTTHFYLS